MIAATMHVLTCPLVLLAVAAGSGASCTQADNCSCFEPPAVTIVAPAGAIAAVKFGGTACVDALPVCPENSSATYPAGCTHTLIFPRHSGTCDIDIELADGGAQRASVTLVNNSSSCCSSPQPSDPDSGMLVVGGGRAELDGG